MQLAKIDRYLHLLGLLLLLLNLLLLLLHCLSLGLTPHHRR